MQFNWISSKLVEWRMSNHRKCALAALK